MKKSEGSIEQRWIELWKRTPESRRFEIGMQMMQSLRRRIEAGVRGQHPDWSEMEVRFETFRRLYWGDLRMNQLHQIRKAYFQES